MRRWLLLPPLAAVVIHLLWIHGYGYFRDELYYLACARHPAWGYVDQPPLSIWLLWAVTHTLGTSLPAIRLLPALTAGGVVLVTGLMAEALGGEWFAQTLAMVAALVAPVFLGIGSFYSMNIFDVLVWTLAAYLLIRIFGAGEARWWPWLGLLLGLGLLNKISVLWLAFGLAVGLLLTSQRRWLKQPGPWVAGGIAGVLFLPYVLWQIPHHWATLEFMRNATGEKMAAVSPAAFLGSQILTMHPLTLPIWLAGLVFYLGMRDGRPFRPLGIAFLTVLVLLVVNGKSRAGYLAPAYPMLFAAGAVVIARALARPRLAILRPAALAVLLVGGVVTAPLAMPILPVPAYVRYARALGVAPSTEENKRIGVLPQYFADMQGWPQMVASIAAVYNRLPAAERADAAIFTGNYGEAGAIDLFGARFGLPYAISGHNNYWIWGPGDASGRVVVLLASESSLPRLRTIFDSVQEAGRVDCGDCMPYEDHQPIFVARGLKLPMAQLWPRLKHYE